jgi:hypothetical protein
MHVLLKEKSYVVLQEKKISAGNGEYVFIKVKICGMLNYR